MDATLLRKVDHSGGLRYQQRLEMEGAQSACYPQGNYSKETLRILSSVSANTASEPMTWTSSCSTGANSQRCSATCKQGPEWIYPRTFYGTGAWDSTVFCRRR
ncbi:hypothetical protein JTB14_037638 [Gonioctena quinquepunctata]|nr:hypothetical protein JTB14_037638 [Gonioctena quinquepunctata]